MANIFDSLSTEVFQVLKSFGQKMTLYDDHGQKLFNPKKARKFFTQPDKMFISIDDENIDSALSMYIGSNIETKNITKLINSLRQLSTRYNLLFNIRKYGKTLSPKDFAYRALPVVESDQTGITKMKSFKHIKLSNSAQLHDLSSKLVGMGCLEDVDFSVYGNSIVVESSIYIKTTNYLSESTGAIINEAPEDKFLAYATAWVNRRNKNSGIKPIEDEKTEKATAEMITSLADGLKSIIMKTLKFNIVARFVPKFTSKTSELAHKLDLLVQPGSGMTNDALWLYVSSLVDKLQHGDKIDANEGFFAERLLGLIDSKLPVSEDHSDEMVEEGGEPLVIEDEPEVTAFITNALTDIKNTCSEQGIDLTTQTTSFAELTDILITMMCQKAIDMIEGIKINHYDDFSRIVKSTFGVQDFDNAELPEIQQFDSWLSSDVVESRDFTGKYDQYIADAIDNFDVRDFLNEMEYEINFNIPFSEFEEECIDWMMYYLSHQIAATYGEANNDDNVTSSDIVDDEMYREVKNLYRTKVYPAIKANLNESTMNPNSDDVYGDAIDMIRAEVETGDSSSMKELTSVVGTDDFNDGVLTEIAGEITHEAVREAMSDHGFRYEDDYGIYDDVYQDLLGETIKLLKIKFNLSKVVEEYDLEECDDDEVFGGDMGDDFVADIKFKKKMTESFNEGDQVMIVNTKSSFDGLKGKISWINDAGSHAEVHFGKGKDGKANEYSFEIKQLKKV